jgi:hypothetical protein
MAAASFAVTACVSSEQASLSVRWQLESGEARAVRPSEALQTAIHLTNDGSTSLEDLVLRFDQVDTRSMPFGLTVGTATHVSSRFDGNTQVWELGTLEPGQTLVFPMSLWFDSSTVTLEPRHVRLFVNAESTNLEGQVVSNALEVEVDTRAVVSQ